MSKVIEFNKNAPPKGRALSPFKHYLL